ncbi:hypothetical protein K474DRAFT_1685035 [Panus rudis PR-1116 ss-1]|nr:hypothetical protein K474DRAFT_1685035 [Panus rudis PR-1116 ss-1]
MALHGGTTSVHLGGTTAIVIFVLILVGFVVETQLTQYVQTTLNYHQPYLIFYFVHSFFGVIFPIHFLYLCVTTKHSPASLWNGLIYAIRIHLSSDPGDPTSPFPAWPFTRLILLLTIGITLPGLAWFAAVSWAPVTDVTALWNTNAFWAYVVAVKLFGLSWDSRRLFAVSLATAGATAVVYGSSTITEEDPLPTSADDTSGGSGATARAASALLGDLLTLVAAIIYGLYQVLYKKYAALPSDPDAELEAMYEPIPELMEEYPPIPLPPTQRADIVYPPPFALYPNLITTAIGICTLLLLWIPVPIVRFLGVGSFSLPADLKSTGVIFGIALSGLVFNAGFMILLGLWGPILTSIGSLLTIVLVFLSDVVFGGAIETITIWSLLGCGSIVAAFGVLAYDMKSKGSS